jgi:hypothetical protein
MVNYGGGGDSIVLSPSSDQTGTRDTADILNAMSKAGATGGTIGLRPGDYYISQPLQWNQLSAASDVHAPSIIGAGSGGDPSTAPTGEGGATRLIPSTSFPVGEFMIDYLGPTAVNASMAGFTVQGLLIQGADPSGTLRAAGVRGFNQFMAKWRDISVIKPYGAPNPAVKPGGISPAGAVSMYASPTSNALMNRLEQIWLMRAQYTGFWLQEGFGSYLVATACSDFNASAYGFDVGPETVLIGCTTSREGFAQYHINDALAAGGGPVQLIGCQTIATFTSSVQALLMTGVQYMSLQATGCFFGACANDNVGGDFNAIAEIGGYALAVFSGCTFAATNAHINKYIALTAGMTAGSLVQFDGCQFTGQMWGQTPAAIYNLNGNPASMLSIKNSPLANPFGVQVVNVPASGTAVAAVPYDRMFYVTAAAGGGCTLAISGGPTVTVPASTLVPVLVPAGQTLTPVYGAGNAPTWVVEGN